MYHILLRKSKEDAGEFVASIGVEQRQTPTKGAKGIEALGGEKLWIH